MIKMRKEDRKIQLIAKNKRVGSKCVVIVAGKITKCTIKYVDKNNIWLKNDTTEDPTSPFSFRIVGFTEFNSSTVNEARSIIDKSEKHFEEVINFL